MLLLLGRVHMPPPQSVSRLSACHIKCKGVRGTIIIRGLIIGLRTNESKQCPFTLTYQMETLLRCHKEEDRSEMMK